MVIKKIKIRYLLATLLLILIFVLGRFSNQYEIVEIGPNNAPELRMIDSLKQIFAKRNDTITALLKTNDSLIRVTNENKNKLQKDIRQIKNFTNDSRNRWNDSVLSSAGLK